MADDDVESERDENAPSQSGGPGQGAIVVVDADPVSRNEAEDLEDDLDQPVVAFDPVDFELDASEEVLSAVAILLDFDLEIRSGIDLLEQIRVHDTLADVPVLLAFARPDARRVRLAVDFGASGVCCKPYDADEIRARLDAIAGPAAADAA